MPWSWRSNGPLRASAAIARRPSGSFVSPWTSSTSVASAEYSATPARPSPTIAPRVLEAGTAEQLVQPGDHEPRGAEDHDERWAELAERRAGDEHDHARTDAEQEHAERMAARTGLARHERERGRQPGAAEQAEPGAGDGVAGEEREHRRDELERHDEAEQQERDRLRLAHRDAAELQDTHDDARGHEGEDPERQGRADRAQDDPADGGGLHSVAVAGGGRSASWGRAVPASAAGERTAVRLPARQRCTAASSAA
jgi:hypothetical protein